MPSPPPLPSHLTSDQIQDLRRQLSTARRKANEAASNSREATVALDRAERILGVAAITPPPPP